jgi:hypothetical protein
VLDKSPVRVLMTAPPDGTGPDPEDLDADLELGASAR